MGTYLVLVGSSHVLDNLLTLGLRHATLLGNNLSEERVDFTCHVGGITADVKVGLLLKQLVDLLGPLLKAMLDVNLLRAVTGEGCDQLELVAQNVLEVLMVAMRVS